MLPPPFAEEGDPMNPMEFEANPREVTAPAQIRESDALRLFLLCHSREVGGAMALWTHRYIRVPKDSTRPRSRAQQSHDTTAHEIYLFLGIRIHMMLHPEVKVEAYRKGTGYARNHGHAAYVSRNRFQELGMRFRVAPPTATDVYGWVCQASGLCSIAMLMCFVTG
ncbi:hypothetical protein EYC84_001469 [Monilinia fructicola]|uniref:PiggyBac transposable element-derived protein domain-containing protein n=1 Tax=Monilinia fructicola TaxID=38448 RepID=A0A5M9JTS1_MONFR|nr:hypothetical protein EYC84_001469 [Monilinia fructicola]